MNIVDIAIKQPMKLGHQELDGCPAWLEYDSEFECEYDNENQPSGIQ